jgi:glycosyltransferase involved in cell wall biosynthesis
MRIAFYAPLKPPTHPIPSGDREVGRLILAALRRAGHEPELAARLRSRDGAGDPARQAAFAEIGEQIARRLIRRYGARPRAQRPAAWITYHLYYKAPDWIGPAAARALDLPYIVVEASHAPKRAASAWAAGHMAVEAAIRRADAVVQLNPADVECIRPLLAGPDKLVMLKPFLDGAPYRAAARERDAHRLRLAQRQNLDPAKPWLLAVGMMREGEKLASYRLLGDALGWIGRLEWELIVIGDGAARAAVEAALAPLGRERIRFAGLLAREHLPEIYAAADLLVWPAIGEAYGMAILEAQAAGLPVIAGDSGGVSGIVADGATGRLLPPGDAPAFANAVDLAIADPATRRKWARAAIRKILTEHDLEGAARTLDGLLRRLAPGKAERETASLAP